MRHILICGERNSGKTALFERLLQECRMPVYGFVTSITTTREDGYHEIYMFPAGEADRTERKENHVGSCNMKERMVNLEVFEQMGLRLLQEAKPDGVITMDELGFMEAGAPAFCEAVLKCLDGEIPVLATVKAGGPDVEFLNRVRNHPNADLYRVSPDHVEELYQILSSIVESWNMRSKC